MNSLFGDKYPRLRNSALLALLVSMVLLFGLKALHTFASQTIVAQVFSVLLLIAAAGAFLAFCVLWFMRIRAISRDKRSDSQK
ncbi:hypothetical protein [Schaalia sp. lx-100]|uniref:hypothetical protein n=1 Tax=Schaalia sp. lx-100 TaxID=2899081 RepID=UPI001E2DB4AC|nr:hypothetical protein [Schaalia sp. lx-100]MCD4556674.1 hypothetical protein [Schaalia sp. lx-100]